MNSKGSEHLLSSESFLKPMITNAIITGNRSEEDWKGAVCKAPVGGEMAQQAKSLLCKYENLSLDPNTQRNVG